MDRIRRQPSTDGSNLTPAQRALHNNFVTSVQVLKRSLVRTIYYLGQIKDLNVHKTLGFDTIAAYAEAVAGLTANQTKGFLLLARRLPEFPAVASALANGDLSWDKARHICAHTDPADQKEWLDLAQSLPREGLRKAMRSRRDPPQLDDGDRRVPSPAPASSKPRLSPRTPIIDGVSSADGTVAPTRNYVALKFSPEQLARWARLAEHLQKGAYRSREELILDGLAALAGGPSDTLGGPPYLVVILQCPTCTSAQIVSSRGEAGSPPALLLAARCDATVEDENAARRSTIAPLQRRRAMRRARYRCEASGCHNTQFLEIHHRRPISGGGTDRIENLVVLCWKCHRALHESDTAAREALEAAPG